MPIRGSGCRKTSVIHSVLRGMGAGEGKRGVKGDQHFPMHADHTRQRDKCTHPSPTGDVDGFQPFEAEGIASRILYRIYIR